MQAATNSTKHTYTIMKKDITCLYVIVIISIIANAVLSFGWYTLRGKNQDLIKDTTVLRERVRDLRDEFDTHHKNACGWMKFESDIRKMDQGEISALKSRAEYLEKRVRKLEVELLDPTPHRNMSEIYRALTQIKEEQFKLSHQVSSNTNYIKDLEENLEITNTFQWSAIRKLKQACPWVGLFD